MSAFICGQDHFKALAIFGASRSGGYGSERTRVDPRYITELPEAVKGYEGTMLASAYADILYQENIRSVRGRYPSYTWETMPGPMTKPLHVIMSGQDMCSAKLRLNPVWILKMCDCLEYQSCETDDYRQTLGFDLLDRIRGAAINALPGYDDAPWDYCADDQTLKGAA